MISFMIRYYGQGNKIIKEKSYSSKNSTLVLNDKLLENCIIQANLLKDDIAFFDMFLNCSHINLIVEKISLFSRVSVYSSSNIESSINLLKVQNVDITISGFKIGLFQPYKSSILVSNCKIDQLDYDIQYEYELLKNNNIRYENIGKKLDIRNSRIKNLGIHSNVKYLNIQESVVDNFHTYSLKDTLNIENFHIWNGTNINKIRIMCKVNKLKIEESDISKLLFSNKSIVVTFEQINSSIKDVYFCNEETIVNKDKNVWKIIKKSAKNDENDKLYEKASFMIMDIERKTKKGFAKKLPYNFLRLSVGYGYKPFRALIFSACCILGFGVLYFLIDLPTYIYDKNSIQLNNDILEVLGELGQRIYFSGITFTTIGYRDITPSSVITKIFSIIEGILGISVLSLFIFSLTKRYGEK